MTGCGACAPRDAAPRQARNHDSRAVVERVLGCSRIKSPAVARVAAGHGDIVPSGYEIVRVEVCLRERIP